MPPEERNCLLTTAELPAVPKKIILAIKPPFLLSGSFCLIKIMLVQRRSQLRIFIRQLIDEYVFYRKYNFIRFYWHEFFMKGSLVALTLSLYGCTVPVVESVNAVDQMAD